MVIGKTGLMKDSPNVFKYYSPGFKVLISEGGIRKAPQEGVNKLYICVCMYIDLYACFVSYMHIHVGFHRSLYESLQRTLYRDAGHVEAPTSTFAFSSAHGRLASRQKGHVVRK